MSENKKQACFDVILPEELNSVARADEICQF